MESTIINNDFINTITSYYNLLVISVTWKEYTLQTAPCCPFLKYSISLPKNNEYILLTFINL